MLGPLEDHYMILGYAPVITAIYVPHDGNRVGAMNSEMPLHMVADTHPIVRRVTK